MIRLGMIGCGGISQMHRMRFHALGSRMKVTATADIQPERAQEAAQVVGADYAVTDFRDLLPHVDAVLIALPHHLHHPVGRECLVAGKHVLMEKPLANSEQECLDLIKRAQQQGVKLMVAYCMRFHPLTPRIKELKEHGPTPPLPRERPGAERMSKRKVRLGKQEPRYTFFLNPYQDERFTSCPQCRVKMRQRKLPLVIHVDPMDPIALNKTCRYCPDCDLLIAHQDEIESLLAQFFSQHKPEVVGNAYLVLGTFDRAVWQEGMKRARTIEEMRDNLHDFVRVVQFEVRRGWFPTER